MTNAANPGDLKVTARIQMDSLPGENRHLESETGLNASLRRQELAPTPTAPFGTLASALAGKLEIAFLEINASSYT